MSVARVWRLLRWSRVPRRPGLPSLRADARARRERVSLSGRPYVARRGRLGPQTLDLPVSAYRLQPLTQGAHLLTSHVVAAAWLQHPPAIDDKALCCLTPLSTAAPKRWATAPCAGGATRFPQSRKRCLGE